MGQLALPPDGPVYVDTNVVIYLVERIEPYLPASAPLWDALEAGTLIVLTSQLTLLEVLVKPLREGNAVVAELFRNVLLSTAGLAACRSPAESWRLPHSSALSTTSRRRMPSTRRRHLMPAVPCS